LCNFWTKLRECCLQHMTSQLLPLLLLPLLLLPVNE
jgi:hypothetical protein